jgi:hypothetical protein
MEGRAWARVRTFVAATPMNGIEPDIPINTETTRVSRVAVLLESGRGGAAALAEAAALAGAGAAELTVVAIAPTVATVCRSCGGVSARAYNCAVRDDVADSLQRTVDRMTPVTQRVTGTLLVEGDDPPLEEWVAMQSFDVVLLPSRLGVPRRRRQRRRRRHPAARRLRQQTHAEIRVVGPGVSS